MLSNTGAGARSTPWVGRCRWRSGSGNKYRALPFWLVFKPNVEHQSRRRARRHRPENDGTRSADDAHPAQVRLRPGPLRALCAPQARKPDQQAASVQSNANPAFTHRRFEGRSQVEQKRQQARSSALADLALKAPLRVQLRTRAGRRGRASQDDSAGSPEHSISSGRGSSPGQGPPTRVRSSTPRFGATLRRERGGTAASAEQARRVAQPNLRRWSGRQHGRRPSWISRDQSVLCSVADARRAPPRRRGSRRRLGRSSGGLRRQQQTLRPARRRAPGGPRPRGTVWTSGRGDIPACWRRGPSGRHRAGNVFQAVVSSANRQHRAEGVVIVRSTRD